MILKNEKTNRNLALLGALGGVVLAAALCLSLCFKGFALNTSGLGAWGELPAWRISLSAFLGVVGHMLLLCGLWSGYRIIRLHCHHIKRGMYLFSMAGRSTGVLLHFLLFCMLPILMKTIGTVAGSTALKALVDSIKIMLLPTGVCLVLQLLSAVFVTVALLDKEVHVSKSLAFMNILTMGLVPALLAVLVLDWPYRGALFAAACLGDSLQMLAICGYWRKKAKGQVTK